jgi:hypothetical protein
MRFIMMVKSDARSEAGELPTPELLGKMDVFNGEMLKAGVMLAGEGLRASSHGARVRAVAGAPRTRARTTVQDGPFAEARELVGGFWLVQTPTLADAIAWAQRAPFEEGEIEIRQLYELSDFPADPAEGADGWREQERAFREGAAAAPAAADGAAPAGPARKPGTTRYIAMLKADRVTESGALPSPEALAQMGALMDEVAKSGALLGGEGLKPSARGAKVRFAGAKRAVVDGPFTEAKEMIAGYTIIQVPAKQDAIQFAERWLNVHLATSAVPLESGEIELRALVEAEDFA